MKPFEVIDTHDVEVKCDGPEGMPGHPRVFLHVDVRTGQIQCPYCSRLYVYKNAARLNDTGIKVAV